MSVETRAKCLHGLATVLILLFALQLGLAIVSEFAPASVRYGHALYPIFLGLDPISVPNILINFGLLVVALVAFFYADALEGERFFRAHFVKRQRRREGSVHFSQ